MEENGPSEGTARSASPPSGAERLAVIPGFVLLVAMGAVILVSGLIMPYWAVAALGVVWIVAVAAAITWRARPLRVLVVPFVLLAIWAATAWAGDRFLNWTA